MILLSFLAIPIIVSLGAFLFSGRRITLIEFAIQQAAQIAILGMFCLGITWRNTHDTETWNGRIASKKSERVSCEHSYSCNCRPVCHGSGKDRSCYTHCDTCYEHRYDMDWVASTTNNERIEISRVDRQGLSEPPRWTAVAIGEPTSLPHSYTNPIKASPGSLFRYQGLVERFQKYLPGYNESYYDYYRYDHLVQAGYSTPEAAQINKDLAELNADLGTKKQVNIVLALVGNQPPDYVHALEQHWLGGKKNDVVVVMGIDRSSDTVQWVDTVAWTTTAMLRVKLRDDLKALGRFDREAVMGVIRADVDAYYRRRPMSDFNYLLKTIQPTPGQWIFGMILGLLMSLGITFFVWNNDEQDYEPFTARGYSRTRGY